MEESEEEWCCLGELHCEGWKVKDLKKRERLVDRLQVNRVLNQTPQTDPKRRERDILVGNFQNMRWHGQQLPSTRSQHEGHRFQVRNSLSWRQTSAPTHPEKSSRNPSRKPSARYKSILHWLKDAHPPCVEKNMAAAKVDAQLKSLVYLCTATAKSCSDGRCCSRALD